MRHGAEPEKKRKCAQVPEALVWLLKSMGRYESSCRIFTDREWYAVMRVALAFQCLSGDAYNDSPTQGGVHAFDFRGAQVGQLPAISIE